MASDYKFGGPGSNPGMSISIWIIRIRTGIGGNAVDLLVSNCERERLKVRTGKFSVRGFSLSIRSFSGVELEKSVSKTEFATFPRFRKGYADRNLY